LPIFKILPSLRFGQNTACFGVAKLPCFSVSVALSLEKAGEIWSILKKVLTLQLENDFEGAES